MDSNTKKLTTTAMLAAIAYVVVVVGHIPVVLFPQQSENISQQQNCSDMIGGL